ncbi:hypothetical protein E2C01_089006 [Portunus trituberculatus]|uniref:Uncharacterized protein n=1 Tax=Portunus trituberculatus TaxID=210409 RepID=A0A5B7J7P7_PORTR|nr:hypothetical protein [Portunus trituberculatus]
MKIDDNDDMKQVVYGKYEYQVKDKSHHFIPPPLSSYSHHIPQRHQLCQPTTQILPLVYNQLAGLPLQRYVIDCRTQMCGRSFAHA